MGLPCSVPLLMHSSRLDYVALKDRDGFQNAIRYSFSESRVCVGMSFLPSSIITVVTVRLLPKKRKKSRGARVTSTDTMTSSQDSFSLEYIRRREIVFAIFRWLFLRPSHLGLFRFRFQHVASKKK